MKFPIILTLSLLGIVLPLKANQSEDFINAFSLIQEGDLAEKGGEAQKAVEKYSAALKILRQIKQTAPDWNPNIINYRIKYTSDHITKNGGNIEEATPEEVKGPITTVPPNAVPSESTEQTSSSATSTLDTPTARVVEVPSDDLIKENSTLRQKLQDAESRIQRLQRENEDLRASQEALKRDLEDTRRQLKTLAKGAPSAAALEELQVLQKENTLLRSIVERMYEEDSKRLAAQKRASKNLDEIASQLEILGTPLPSLSGDEKRVLQHSSKSSRNESDDATKLNAVIKAKETTSLPPSEFNGNIVALNPKEKFVVIDFRPGKVPPVQSKLSVYRDNTAIGSVQISEKTKPPLAVADILDGEFQRGDIVR